MARKLLPEKLTAGQAGAFIFVMVTKKNNALSVFAYQGNNITFRQGDTMMVNATEMAKPFGKRPAKWLELPSTQEFLTTLQNIRKSDILIRTERGVNGCTWLHEDVALEFARWISPAFSIWCNDRIKELLLSGRAALSEASDFLGVKPVIYEGRVWYYFRDVVTAIGMSRRSGTIWRYALHYPGETKHIAGRLYCSHLLAHLVHRRYEYRMEMEEIRLSFALGEGAEL